MTWLTCNKVIIHRDCIAITTKTGVSVLIYMNLETQGKVKFNDTNFISFGNLETTISLPGHWDVYTGYQNETQTINEAAKQYTTAVQNHIIFNFHKDL